MHTHSSLPHVAWILWIALTVSVTSCRTEKKDENKSERKEADAAEVDTDLNYRHWNEGRIPSLVELEQTNLLYTGDITTATETGRQMARAHRNIVGTLTEKLDELHKAYIAMYRANVNMTASVVSTVAVAEKAQSNAPWLSEEVDSTAFLVKISGQSELLHRAIRTLRKKIDEIPGAVNESREKSEMQLTLLGFYSAAIQLQQAYRVGPISYFIASHHSAQSVFDESLKKTLRREMNVERKAFNRALSSEVKLINRAYGVSVGITALKELMRIGLKKNIELLSRDIAQVEKDLKTMVKMKNRQEEAQLTNGAVVIYRTWLHAFKEALAGMNEASKQWIGQDVIAAASIEPTFVARLLAFNPLYGVAYADETNPFGDLELKANASMTSDLTLLPATNWNVANATANLDNLGKSDSEGAQQQVRSNVSSLTSGGKTPNFVGKICNTISERKNDIVNHPVGGSIRLVKDSLQGVEDGADYAVKSTVGGAMNVASWAMGSYAPPTWASESVAAGSGKIAAAAVGIFTSIPKGVAQLIDPNASIGERLEGTVNIVFGVMGGSGKVVSKGASAISKVFSGAMNAGRQTMTSLGGAYTKIQSKGMIQFAKANGVALKNTIKEGAEALMIEGGKKIASSYKVIQGGYQAVSESVKKGISQMYSNPGGWLNNMLKGKNAQTVKQFVSKYKDQLTPGQFKEYIASKVSWPEVLQGVFDGEIINGSKALVNQLTNGIGAYEIPQYAPATVTEAPAYHPVDPSLIVMPTDYMSGETYRMPTVKGSAAPSDADLGGGPGEAIEALELVKWTQGKLSGGFGGNISEGTLNATISGTSFSGKVEGRSDKHGATFTGNFNGSYEPESGNVAAVLTGTYVKHTKEDGLFPTGAISASFDGTCRGDGCSGTWQGKSWYDDQGTWYLNGGTVVEKPLP